MIWLILGLLLWTAAHLFKRLAPDLRAQLGEPFRGVATLAIIGSIVLMVIGYRAAEPTFWWGRSPALVGLNNVLMLLAIYCFASSGMKTWLTGKIRHPQLTGFKIFCVAHLLVNGDLASFVLFGGLLAWAVAEVIIINRQDGKAPLGAVAVSPGKELGGAIGAGVATVGVMVVHNWLGVTPWG